MHRFMKSMRLFFKFVIPITLLLLIVGIIVLGWIVRPRFHRKSTIVLRMGSRGSERIGYINLSQN